MRPVIIVFAKAPAPGHVKTRLSPPLTPAAAADLYRRMVERTLDLVCTFGGRADLELHTDRETDAWPRAGVSRRLQVEGDLGARMYAALEAALAAGRARALLLGGDVPTLPPAHLDALLEAAADVALGPVEDGGYYAVCCRRVAPRMFSGVRWSAPTTLADTRRACEAAGLSVQLGPCWFDVDRPEDLARVYPMLPP